MIRRSLTLALAAALASGTAQAADLLQTYEMARGGDTQLAIAESNTLYSKEGQDQARAGAGHPLPSHSMRSPDVHGGSPLDGVPPAPAGRD